MYEPLEVSKCKACGKVIAESKKYFNLLKAISMVKNERGKKFSCLKCGSPFIGYPPDDYHQIASIKESEVGDPIQVEYRCDKCGKTNVLYWGYQKMDVSFG